MVIWFSKDILLVLVDLLIVVSSFLVILGLLVRKFIYQLGSIVHGVIKF